MIKLIFTHSFIDFIGAYFVPQEIQRLNEWRSVVGQSCQTQYQAMQPLNHIPDAMLMHSAMNGYYSTMFTQQPIGTSGGVFKIYDSVLILNDML